MISVYTIGHGFEHTGKQINTERCTVYKFVPSGFMHDGRNNKKIIDGGYDALMNSDTSSPDTELASRAKTVAGGVNPEGAASFGSEAMMFYKYPPGHAMNEMYGVTTIDTYKDKFSETFGPSANDQKSEAYISLTTENTGTLYRSTVDPSKYYFVGTLNPKETRSHFKLSSLIKGLQAYFINEEIKIHWTCCRVHIPLDKVSDTEIRSWITSEL
ncbi:immunoglobulin heavy chain variable domain-containing protein [Pseudomonas sp. 6D_7.1_Bac1]|uniref:immunoglobulin heavy chain variable domain-containing protein n=1 Tax=Pseudomonas sp. 6D_7.1_Bac1 TaxID=2971615 RepID=UPI0021C952D2|nr:immunoglobulin heavy chain variable domain-containing protein [Pseudomonas sp. 6D_7.1_Bac1]MCU1750206.1 immunoglobulin heavy chain variable domain-containing protein [Pseudomonas sp. 6D_7.1_Bac1]